MTTDVINDQAPPRDASDVKDALPPAPPDTFLPRHIGPSDADVREMLTSLDLTSLDELIDQTIPESIRLKRPLNLGAPRAESETLAQLKSIASQNKVARSFIGQGYYDTITPPVV